ncbi:GDSL-type esterase/lipase family protein [Paenibacillus sp. FSL L8-0436]|uniref:GDSL-type esterase/lipase family protein n=1 Tax=Paenibacillus sp. FSL L8-0436 TaxID=2954686 RepID=UPI0031580EC4
MKKIKIILTLSLVTNIFMACVVLLITYKVGGVNFVLSKLEDKALKYSDNPYYIERENIYESTILPQNKTIFLGDSITNRGLWDEWFPNSGTINRGINSDTTEGIKSRLNSVIEAKPSKVFIMAGINDLYEKRSIKKIVSNYSEIMKSFKTSSPDTKVYIQSVLPVNNEMYGDAIHNTDVVSLNTKLKETASKFGYEYVDVYSELSEQNQLLKTLTIEGIHLNGEGYKLWRKVLEKYL